MLEQPGGVERERSAEAVAGQPDRPILPFELRLDRLGQRRPDFGDRVGEALVKPGPHPGRGQVVPEPPLRHHQQVHRVGEQDVLEAVDRGRRLRAAEGDDDVGVVGRQPGLGVVDAVKRGIEAQQILEGRLPRVGRQVGERRSLAEKPGVVAAARLVFVEPEGRRRPALNPPILAPAAFN
jgi:hypothetical protein